MVTLYLFYVVAIQDLPVWQSLLSLRHVELHRDESRDTIGHGHMLDL